MKLSMQGAPVTPSNNRLNGIGPERRASIGATPAWRGPPPSGIQPRRPSMGPNSPTMYDNNHIQTRRHSISQPISGMRPRGPPPTSPYGMMNTPPSRQSAVMGSSGPRIQLESGGVRSNRGPPPRRPIPKGPPPKGPIPTGPPPRTITHIGTPSSSKNLSSRLDHPNNSGRQRTSSSISFRQDQEATPSAWSNTKPSNDDQIRTPQHIQIHTPGSIGPRTPLTSQLSQTRKPPFPTDISQLGPPPSDVKSFAPPFSRNPVKIFGKLMITIMRGKNLKAGQGTFGRANPFVKIKMGQIEVTTEPHVEGGKNPVWDKQFEFDIITEKDMEVEILDKDPVGGEKFMGRATVGILDWIAQETFDGPIEVLDKSGSVAGELIVKVNFFKPEAYEKMKHTNPSSSLSPEFTDDEILEAFRSFDLDKNNYVGAAEIRHVLINIGETVEDEVVDEMIRMVDKDGDGQVSFDEFYKMVSGGKKPPPGLGRRGLYGQNGEKEKMTSTKAIIDARNSKRKLLDKFARDHNLKPESIKRAHRRFVAIDQDKSGLVDYIELCEILQVDPSLQCEELFQMFDYMKTGKIDAKEVLIALANFTGAGKDDKLKFAFLLFDEDNNGVISKSELVKILKANHMAQTDAEVHRKAETIMSQADKNGDGVMSLEEFAAVSKKFPNILFPSYAGRNI